MGRSAPVEDADLAPTEEELNTITPIDDGADIPLDDTPDEPIAAAPAAKPVDATEAAKAPDDQKTVDIRALQEARAETREARQRATVLEQRWDALLAAQAKPAAPEQPAKPQMPGDDDPMGQLQWLKSQMLERQEREQQTEQQTTQQRQEEAAFQQAYQKVDADFTTAETADPSLRLAYNALRESQGKELLALGYTIPQAKAELDRAERQHVMFVASRGLEIGTYIKNLAAARGWSPGAPAAAQQAAPAAGAQPAKPDLAAVAEAQQRHQSLSDAPGGEMVPPLDAKALARMSDGQFKAWMSKKGNEQRFDEIMGKG